MSYLNKQIATYLEDKDLKSHQQQTLEILKREAIPSGDILELGSANATMLIRIADLFPDKNIDGVEIAPNLHDIAVTRTKDLPNIHCVCEDIQKFKPTKQYAALVAEGVHSIFDDPEIEIARWMEMIKPGGYGLIFGLFSKTNLDYRFYYKNLENNYDWEAGLNGTSVKTVSDVLSKAGYDFTFIPFNIDFDLEQSENPIRSYTKNIGQDKRLIVADALITHMYHLVIRKK